MNAMVKRKISLPDKIGPEKVGVKVKCIVKDEDDNDLDAKYWLF